MASADFSDPFPLGCPAGSPWVSGPDRRSLEVRHAFFFRTRRIYPHGVCVTIGRPRRWPGYPRHDGLIRFLYVTSEMASSAFFRSRLATGTLA